MNRPKRANQLVVVYVGISFLCLGCCLDAFAQHPREFVTMTEEAATGKVHTIDSKSLKTEIDVASDIVVRFDRNALLSLVKNLGDGDKAQIRVEASIVRQGSSQSTPLPIDNYYILVRDKSGNVSDVTIVEQAIINNSGVASGFVPDAILDLTAQALNVGDTVRLRITNLWTQDSIDKTLVARKFGFPSEVRDSFFFLKRLNVDEDARKEGVDKVNFAPAPGVTYQWTVAPRKNAFWRTLRPSFGVNVSFADWDDPAFDQATGQFLAGTKGSDIEITSGVVVGVFEGVLQFTWGANLNVEKNRGYFGIGFSFVNVVDRLGKLIAKK